MIVRSAQAVQTQQFVFLIATMTCAQIVAAMSLSVVFPTFDVFELPCLVARHHVQIVWLPCPALYLMK